MVELLETRRSFIGPDEETEYFISSPSAEMIRGADWQYSKIYTRCLTEGITTSAEMTDILRRRGIIGPDYDLRTKELSMNLNKLVRELREAKDNQRKAELAIEISEARDDLFRWNQRLSGPMSNTCEQISDDTRLEYLTACMIENKEGKRVWETYDDFLKIKSQALSTKAKYEVMLFLQGYDSDFLEKTPEAIAMREIEADLLAKAQKELAEIDEAEAAAEAEVVEEAEVAVESDTQIEAVIASLPIEDVATAAEASSEAASLDVKDEPKKAKASKSKKDK